MLVSFSRFSILIILFQEIHLLHKFEEDFYDSHLNVIALGYIRPMCDFSSLGM